MNSQNFIMIGLGLLVIFFLLKPTRENFYSLDHINSSDYLECCQKWGCGSWACQQLLLYKKPLIRFIGSIYSPIIPQRSYSLFKRFNNETASYDYVYQNLSPQGKMTFVKIPTSHPLKDGEVIMIDSSHSNGQEKFIVKEDHMYKKIKNSIKSPSYGSIKLNKGYFSTSIKPYSEFHGLNVGHNIDYDHYYPPLYGIYKRPSHYDVSGDFVTTTGKYGILKPIKLEKNKDGDHNTNVTFDKDMDDYNIEYENNNFMELYEKEIEPKRNEYQYFVKNGNKLIEIPIHRRIYDGDIVRIPGSTILYKFERTEFY